MRKHSIWSAATIVLAVLCLLAVISATDPSVMGAATDASAIKAPVQRESASDAAAGTLRCKYFIERDFMSSIIEANGSNQAIPVPENILGGFVPHHLLAGEMIASFFKTLSNSLPDTVVVVAPNHKRTGANGIHTSALDWGTAFGILEADRPLIEILAHDFNASQSTLLMEEEHSISSLVPYIKYFLPDAKIVPVLLHGNYSTEDSVKLGEWLTGLQAGQKDTGSSSSGSPAVSGTAGLSDNRRIAVIASVDFSHYLNKAAADKMDEKTLAAIQSNDIQAISRMGNDNVDSPPSVIVLISAMKKGGISAPAVLAHGNSSDITGTGADYTTSYYTLLYGY